MKWKNQAIQTNCYLDTLFHVRDTKTSLNVYQTASITVSNTQLGSDSCFLHLHLCQANIVLRKQEKAIS